MAIKRRARSALAAFLGVGILSFGVWSAYRFGGLGAGGLAAGAGGVKRGAPKSDLKPWPGDVAKASDLKPWPNEVELKPWPAELELKPFPTASRSTTQPRQAATKSPRR